MNMIRLGIICPSEIALRRFMPALQKIEDISFVGIGISSPEERFGSKLEDNNVEQKEIILSEYKKAEQFINQYGGKIFDSYQDIVETDEIDAIYIPLPPALHYKWAKLALQNCKHVLVEKPSTTSFVDTQDLVNLAKQKSLALHENYMFAFHNQLEAIKNIIDSKEIGDVRLYRISFGFPRRQINDFRYNKLLGGGALIDAGGYTLKYASILLGETAELKYAQMNYTKEDEVDIYGSAALCNSDGITAQIAYGMDNDYKCELEVWGSKGTLMTGRVLTAPAGFIPNVVIRKNNIDENRELPSDDAFFKSINYFLKCIDNENIRKRNYDSIVKQAKLVQDFKDLAENQYRK